MCSQVTKKLQLNCFMNDEQPRENPRPVRQVSASVVLVLTAKKKSTLSQE